MSHRLLNSITATVFSCVTGLAFGYIVAYFDDYASTRAIYVALGLLSQQVSYASSFRVMQENSP